MNTRGSLWNDAVMCQSQSEDTVSKAAFLKGQQHPIGYQCENSPPAPSSFLGDVCRGGDDSSLQYGSNYGKGRVKRLKVFICDGL